MSASPLPPDSPSPIPPAGVGARTEPCSWRAQQRADLLAVRERLPVAVRNSISRLLVALLEQELIRLGRTRVGLYWPFRGEPDVRLLATSELGESLEFALPVVVERGRALEFWRWWPGMSLGRGIWNIPVPAERDVIDPDVLIVPVVGYDHCGYRLGYGGGYYDRTLAGCEPRPLAIGVGYAAAELDTIRPQSHDIAMDMIMTENGIVTAREAGRKAAAGSTGNPQPASARVSAGPGGEA